MLAPVVHAGATIVRAKGRDTARALRAESLGPGHWGCSPWNDRRFHMSFRSVWSPRKTKLEAVSIGRGVALLAQENSNNVRSNSGRSS